MQLIRLEVDGGAHWAVRTEVGKAPLKVGLDDLLQMSLDERSGGVESAGAAADLDGILLPPVDSQEVWGAGVTYEQSRAGRIEESTEAGVYDRVYIARRRRCSSRQRHSVWSAMDSRSESAPTHLEHPRARAGPGAQCRREIFGYVVGDDVSSRSIEGENPLYLLQA